MALRKTIAAALGLLLPLLALSALPPAQAAEAGSLTVSPQVYIGGQGVTLKGNIGAPGVRRVHLESHMGRPGDYWVNREVYFRTDEAGNFSYTMPAPSMFNIRFRVRSGNLYTPAWNFRARSPESVLTFDAGDDRLAPAVAVAGRSFTVQVNTVPELKGRKAYTPPVIEGRTVTLQKRVSPTVWQTLDASTIDSRGQVYFTLTEQAGTHVYRVRQENWYGNGSNARWIPSFPTYLQVAPTLSEALKIREPGTEGTTVAPEDKSTVTNPPRSGGGSLTAASVGLWGPQLFDFGWEVAQAITDPPSGQRPRGGWLDASDGTGRVVQYNGGLNLQSKLERLGRGDWGTTTATVKGNAQRYGRWEFRIRGQVIETGSPNYRAVVELVPAGAAVQDCTPRTITVADFRMQKKGVRMGLRKTAGGAAWLKVKKGAKLDDVPRNVAVEVGRKHITWFYDGRPVATLKGAKANMGVKLVPRMRLVGGGTVERNSTRLISDWQRAWTLERGKQFKKSPAPRKTSYRNSCSW